MNLKEYLRLNSREKDALIAKEIFGWEHTQHAPEGHFCHIVGNDKGWWKSPEWKGWGCAVCENLPPHYTEDLATAWQVIEKMRPEKGKPWVDILTDNDHHFFVNFGIYPNGVWSGSFPEAVCAAALLAMGVIEGSATE
jgi:hypothetical protein